MSSATKAVELVFAYSSLNMGTGEYEVEVGLTERLGRALRRALVVGVPTPTPNIEAKN